MDAQTADEAAGAPAEAMSQPAEAVNQPAMSQPASERVTSSAHLLRRIHIVGASGSGKTTLARAAAAALGVAHLELDAVFWDRDWNYRELAQAHALVRSFAAANPRGWVMDGNWNRRRQGLLEPGGELAPDLVVWLDHSRLRTSARVLRRTLWRGLTRQELWHGNRERPGSWLLRDPQENIVLFAWRQHARYRTQARERGADPSWLRLSGQRAVDRWLATLRP